MANDQRRRNGDAQWQDYSSHRTDQATMIGKLFKKYAWIVILFSAMGFGVVTPRLTAKATTQALEDQDDRIDRIVDVVSNQNIMLRVVVSRMCRQDPAQFLEDTGVDCASIRAWLPIRNFAPRAKKHTVTTTGSAR